MKLTKSLPLIALLLVSLLAPMLFVDIAYADGENWLEGWNYRQSHTLTQLSGAGTNYQVKLTIDYSNGVSSGDTCYVNGSSQIDFDDIRFTDNDGSTLLDCWLERKTDSDDADFWIEISDDLGASNVAIYVYYGNVGASSVSDGVATFILFDNFNDDSLNASLWDSVGDVSESGASVVVGSNSDQFNFINTVSTYSQGTRFYARVDIDATSGASDCLSYHGIGMSVSTGAQPWTAGSEINMFGWSYRGESQTWYSVDGVHSSFDAMSYFNGYFVYCIQRGSSEQNFVIDDDEKATDSPATTAYNYWINAYTSDYYVTCDWAFIAKFVDGDVTHGAWGAQETQPSPDAYVTYTFSSLGVLNATHGGNLTINSAISNGSSIQYSSPNWVYLFACPNNSTAWISLTVNASTVYTNPHNLTFSGNTTVHATFNESGETSYLWVLFLILFLLVLAYAFLQ